jgi:DNA-binding beta-propeller fold protein YncE
VCAGGAWLVRASSPCMIPLPTGAGAAHHAAVNADAFVYLTVGISRSSPNSATVFLPSSPQLSITSLRLLASTTWRYQRCVVIGTATPVPVAVCPAADDDNVEMTPPTVSCWLSTRNKSAFPLSVTTPSGANLLPRRGHHCLTGISARAFHWAFGGTREWPHGARTPLWASTEGLEMVPRAQPKASDDTLGTFNVGTNPLGVAFDGANIWVANAVANGTVSKM